MTNRQRLTATLAFFFFFGINDSHAQTAKYYSDNSNIVHLAVLDDQIWAASQTSLLHLDSKGKLVKEYTLLDGFPTSLELAQDERGHIWAKDINFLREWDGKQWTNHDDKLEKASVRFVPELRQIWLVNSKQLSQIKAGKWWAVPTPAALQGKDNWATVFHIFEDSQQRIWLELSDESYHLWEKGVWKSIDYMPRVFEDINGRIWATNKNEDFYYWEDNDWKHTEALDFSLKINYFEAPLWLDKQTGKTYHKRSHRELCIFDGKEWTCTTPPFHPHTLIQDNKGRFWVAGIEGHIARWESDSFYVFQLENRLPIASKLEPTAIIHDGNGGTMMGGAMPNAHALTYKNGEWTKHCDKSLYDVDIQNQGEYFFKNKNGGYWLVSNNYVLEYKGGKWSKLLNTDGLNIAFVDSLGRLSMLNYKNELLTIADDGSVSVTSLTNIEGGYIPHPVYAQNALWIPQGDTVVKRCANGACEDIKYKEKGSIFMYNDGADRVWINWNFGKALQMYDNGKLYEFEQPAPSRVFHPVSDSKGNTWVDNGGFIWIWSGASWRKWGKSGSINALFVDSKNQLWLAGSNEIRCYNADTKRLLGKWEGFFSDLAPSFFEDAESGVWLNLGYKGLVRLGLGE